MLACLTVNDVFVTEEWGRAHQAKGKVRSEVLSEGSDPGGRIPCFPLHLLYFMCWMGTHAMVYKWRSEDNL